MKKQLTSLLAAGVLLILASCGGQKSEAPVEGAGEIKIDGSSTVFPITEAVAEEFKASFPNVKVTVGLSGTGGGFKKFSRNEIDINDASRAIKAGEDSSCQAAGIAYTSFEIAYDGLAIVINPQNTWAKDITVEELKKLWAPEAQGKITKWNQIRASWPAEEIHLFGAGVESGTYDYFTEAIVGKSHSSRGDYTASEDDNVLVQGVSSDKNALGFFGFAYYEQNMDKLKLLPVDDQKDENGKGPIIPTLETVKNKTYSPLSRPLFIYVNNASLKRSETANFLKFYLESAEALTKEVGYIPMTKDEYNAQLSKLSTLTGATK